MFSVVTDIPVCQDRRVFHVGDVVKKLRTQRDWTLEQLAEQAKVNKGTLSALERGEGNFRRDTLERIARALDTTVEALYVALPSVRSGATAPETATESDEIDVSDYTRFDIPVIGEGEASPNGLFWDGEGRPIAHAEEWMSRPGEIREKSAYAIVVRGDSMEPMLKRGYRLILSQVRPVQDGDIVYAQLKSGERLVKVAHRQNGGFVLESYNQAYAPRFVTSAEIDAIHKCVYIRTIK